MAAPLRKSPIEGRLSNVLRHVFLVWPQRRRQRTRLLELEPHELRDIGICRKDALREGRKPFWQGVPRSSPSHPDTSNSPH
ncbi:DUF1127 domain-containing protein [Aliihoeflea aestuarii]|jgi:uncharacterized protein YjiS (DUF1127 family)|uniref:DUF1127 domain-containing protein n=1 Tax=Aliihoeflea aestuarii TaxID=453840 RepID=UPI0020937BDF|nr:DUF1127 domain-containing protein [Aliihoeflea aestuarii]